MKNKVIVLTRGTAEVPDARMWQGTWPAEQHDEADRITRLLQARDPHLPFQLELMDVERAELLEERYRDWASDFDPWS